MVTILLSNVGGLQNPGIEMMLKALTSFVEADFYVHKLTVCRGYKKYGIRYSWKPSGYDLALDLGGDTFTTYYGKIQFLRHCLHLLILWLFKQKYAVFAQTLSPYGKITERIAKFFLEHAHFITVREQRSKRLLEKLEIESVLTADLAFLLNEWDSTDYVGDSYHRVIAAKLAGCKGKWNGARANNFKFDVFRSNLDLEEMRRRARKNLEVLQRVLSR